MLKNAEKYDFINTRAVKICQKVMTGSVQVYEQLYIYGILRKTGHGIVLSWPAVVNLVKSWMSL